MTVEDITNLPDDEIEQAIERLIQEISRRQAEAEHLDRQFHHRYFYLVGEWAGTTRAKSTRNGQFVESREVIDFLTR